MKKLILIKYILILLGVTPILASCNSWLEVDPNDRIMEGDVFSTRKNFLSTLNGVYLELTNPDLYGANLSYGMIDVMGQYYNVSSGDHTYYLFSEYEYGEDVVKKRMDKIWTQSYNMIVNCNTIIEKCGDANEVLGETLHPIVKGEALALRAMLHFDILRLFGPIYRDNKDKKYIPYVTSSAPKIEPLESAEAIMTHILNDLEAAKVLLANDPIITEGARNFDSPIGENDLYYRQYRLNYYAVKALLARAHLWAGNKTEALKYATEIISECQKPIAEGEDNTQIFPFSSDEYALHPVYPDRVFSTEVIFGLYNITRNKIFTENFSPSLSVTAILNFAGEFADGRIPELYPDQNDTRYKMWAEETIKNVPTNFFSKFGAVDGNSNWSTESYRYMMPIIRISEMYLIAAECTPNISEALEKYLNKIRRARKCMDLGASTESELEKNIVEEYRRETICEGQMFFVYKRLVYQNIPNGKEKTDNINIELSSYVVPLPDSEISQRTDYIK